jgi:hypothetical protein
MEEELTHLADLIRVRNAVAKSITTFIGRPALIGHAGEFIASRIFGIELEPTATAKGIDGRFTGGKLAGNGVDVKWYAKNEGLLAIRGDALPDFYLVMTGPRTGAWSSKGEVRPWSIDYVYLIGARALVQELTKRGIRLSEATSVRREDWDRCELYPESRCPYLTLSDDQRAMLELFDSKSIGI